MNPQIIIALVLALGGFGAAWQIQDWRYGAQEAEREQQKLADVQQAAARNQQMAASVIAAQNEAKARDSRLRLDAAGSRNALVSLHTAAASAMSAASVSHTACVERADTLAQLLGTMADAGGDIAAKADRHANDAQTLMAAWPK